MVHCLHCTDEGKRSTVGEAIDKSLKHKTDIVLSQGSLTISPGCLKRIYVLQIVDQKYVKPFFFFKKHDFDKNVTLCTPARKVND